MRLTDEQRMEVEYNRGIGDERERIREEIEGLENPCVSTTARTGFNQAIQAMLALVPKEVTDERSDSSVPRVLRRSGSGRAKSREAISD